MNVPEIAKCPFDVTFKVVIAFLCALLLCFICPVLTHHTISCPSLEPETTLSLSSDISTHVTHESCSTRT